MTTAKNQVPAKKTATLKDWLQSDAFKREMAQALPKGKDADNMIRSCISSVSRNPKLAECDQTSFLTKSLELAEWGLLANGRDAHLIPFRNRKKGIIEVQLILDYKGIVQLLYRSGHILSIHADVVHEGDLFKWNLGEVIAHTPWVLRRDVQKPNEKGKAFAVYVRIVLRGGAIKCEIMDLAEVEKIRGRSKAAKDGPWVTDWSEMAKKTVFKRACKWLPMSAELVAAMGADDDTQPVGSLVTGGGVVVEQPTSLDQLAEQLTPGTAAKMLEEQEAAAAVEAPPELPNPVSDPPTPVEAYLHEISQVTAPGQAGLVLGRVRDDKGITDMQFELIEDAVLKREDEFVTGVV